MIKKIYNFSRNIERMNHFQLLRSYVEFTNLRPTAGAKLVAKKVVEAKQKPEESVLSDSMFKPITHVRRDVIEASESYEGDGIETTTVRLCVDHTSEDARKYEVEFTQPGKVPFKDSKSTQGFWDVWDLENCFEGILELEEEAKNKFREKLVLVWSNSIFYFVDHLGEGYRYDMLDECESKYFSNSKENTLWSHLAVYCKLDKSKVQATNELKKRVLGFLMRLMKCWIRCYSSWLKWFKFAKWRISNEPEYDPSEDFLKALANLAFLPTWIIDNVLAPFQLTKSIFESKAKEDASRLFALLYQIYDLKQVKHISLEVFESVLLSSKWVKKMENEADDYINELSEDDNSADEENAPEEDDGFEDVDDEDGDEEEESDDEAGNVDGQAEAGAPVKKEEEEEDEIEEVSIFGKLLKEIFGSIDEKQMEQVLTKIKEKASEVVKTEIWQKEEKSKWKQEGLFWRSGPIGQYFFTTIKDSLNSQSVGRTSVYSHDFKFLLKTTDDSKGHFTTKAQIVSLASHSITLTCRQTGTRTEITHPDNDTSLSEVMTIPGDKNTILVFIETVTENADHSSCSLAKLDLDEFCKSPSLDQLKVIKGGLRYEYNPQILVASSSIVAIMQSSDIIQTDIINLANLSETQTINILNFIKPKEEPKVLDSSEGKNPDGIVHFKKKPLRKRRAECSYNVASMYCVGRRVCYAITKFDSSGRDCRRERIVIWIDTSCTDNPEGASLLGKLTHSIQDDERSKSSVSKKSNSQGNDGQSCDEDSSSNEYSDNDREVEYIWGIYLSNLFLCMMTASMEYCLYFFINSTKKIFSPSNGEKIKIRKPTLQKDKFRYRGSIWDDKTKSLLAFSDDGDGNMRKTVLKLKL
jgi:hypothetical protein